jgi:hypothetical protein
MHFTQAGQLLGEAYQVVVKGDSYSHGSRFISIINGMQANSSSPLFSRLS